MSDVIHQTEGQMKERLNHLMVDYKNLRTSRVNPAMLDSVQVEVYGSKMAIKALGTVSVQDRQLIVTPFDPSTSKDIAKAITASSMDLNPIIEKTSLRIPIPPLNESLRKEITKQAKQMTEDTKISIRDVRRKSNDQIKKQKQNGEISEDDQKRSEKAIQDLTDRFCKQLDGYFHEKEKEIMTV